MFASFYEKAEAIRSDRVKEDPLKALINDYMIRAITVENEMMRLIMDIQSMRLAYDAEESDTGKKLRGYKEQITA